MERLSWWALNMSLRDRQMCHTRVRTHIQKTATWQRRQGLAGGGHNHRLPGVPGREKRQEGTFPGASGGGAGFCPMVLIPDLWPPELQRMNFCCFEPP